jgi:hypothetical protein
MAWKGRKAGIWGEGEGDQDRAQEWVFAGFSGNGSMHGHLGFSSPFPTQHWVAWLVLSSKFHKSSLFHLTGGMTNSLITALAIVKARFWPPNRQVWQQVATGVVITT